jgi:putative addiction module component (TIGR02574 family)
MPKSLSEVTRYASELTPQNRMKLVSALLGLPKRNSASSMELEKSWKKEIERRMAEFRAGKVRMIPWEEVKRGIEKKLVK